MMLNQTVLDNAKVKMDAADEIWLDFAGKKRQGGLTLTFVGEYVIVDDEADRWLATSEDYQDALNSVLETALSEGYVCPERGGVSDAYNDLCNECPAMYSRIGSGDFNRRETELIAELAKTLTAEQIDEICRELGIEMSIADETRGAK